MQQRDGSHQKKLEAMGVETPHPKNLIQVVVVGGLQSKAPGTPTHPRVYPPPLTSSPHLTRGGRVPEPEGHAPPARDAAVVAVRDAFLADVAALGVADAVQCIQAVLERHGLACRGALRAQTWGMH